MNILSIETSAGVCSCAILKGKDLIKQIHINTKEQQVNLLPSIDKLFKQTRIKKEEINLICVDVGPGSFTALRIGVSTAKSLAHALNVPIIGINSLNAIYSLSVEKFQGNLNRVCLIDAKRSKLFASIFFQNGKQITNLDLSIENILYYINDCGKVLFAGRGTEKYSNKIKELRKGKETLFLQSEEIELSAYLIGKLGVDKYKKFGPDNLHSLVPVYVRQTDEVTKGS